MFPLDQFKPQLNRSDRDFYQALRLPAPNRPAYILECKKASPSKGLIRANFDLNEIAQIYRHYASAISVLTDEKYFQGNFAYINQVRSQVSQPILCKDFIISDYQVYLARYYQADAILLMLSVLGDSLYEKLSKLAHQLGMGVLTEVSNQAELDRALALDAKVIGINNRDLRDLSIDLEKTPYLAQQIPSDRIIISESGISNHQQIQYLSRYAQGFLIGSSLMAKADLNDALRSLIFGENKVCGLTRTQDIKAAYQAGALYAGLIFANNSPRRLSLEQAESLICQAPLRFVGVFQDQDLDLICDYAERLGLYAVQLHGSESSEFIRVLRAKLKKDCQIWRAVSVDIKQTQKINVDPMLEIDRYLLDSKSCSQQGGLGIAFDWSLIPKEIKDRAMLAGGIGPDNIPEALAQGCLGLDLNSALESSAGIKDANKLSQAFSLILDSNTNRSN